MPLFPPLPPTALRKYTGTASQQAAGERKRSRSPRKGARKGGSGAGTMRSFRPQLPRKAQQQQRADASLALQHAANIHHRTTASAAGERDTDTPPQQQQPRAWLAAQGMRHTAGETRDGVESWLATLCTSSARAGKITLRRRSTSEITWRNVRSLLPNTGGARLSVAGRYA